MKQSSNKSILQFLVIGIVDSIIYPSKFERRKLI
jgi:hypothetical protein